MKYDQLNIVYIYSSLHFYLLKQIDEIIWVYETDVWR